MLEHWDDPRISAQRRHLVETHAHPAYLAGRKLRPFLYQYVMAEAMFAMGYAVNARSFADFAREWQDVMALQNFDARELICAVYDEVVSCSEQRFFSIERQNLSILAVFANGKRPESRV